MDRRYNTGGRGNGRIAFSGPPRRADIVWRAFGSSLGGRLRALIVLGIMALFMYVLDFLAGAFGAKRFGASNRAIIGATVGAIVGIFFGIPGILIGPFIGAVLGELTAQSDLRTAGRAGIGATVGLALGVAAKLTLAFAMVGTFVVMRFL